VKFTLEKTPKELKREVKVLKWFFKKFTDKSRCNISKKKRIVFVYDCKRTSQAIIFWLSNRNTHFIFNNKTEIILNSKEENIVYFNEKGEKELYNSSTAIKSGNKSMIECLTYARSVLIQIRAGVDIEET